MILTGLAFYLFSVVAILSALMVITARNSVHSVLFLILVFLNSAALFILQGAEFLAMLLVIVYVGAVAVLFLFVVMMLGSSFQIPRGKGRSYITAGLIVGAVLLFELLSVTSLWFISDEVRVAVREPVPGREDMSNTVALGSLIYTRYVYLFQSAGLILLVAMIGSIVLTLRVSPEVKRQNIAEQLARKREDSVEVKSVRSGSGI